MSNSKQIIESLFADDLYTAKKAINEALTSKMAQALEEKLIDFGPSVFSEGKKPDFPDIDGDGNTEEPISKAAKDKERKSKKVNMKEDIENIAEDFEKELQSLVEEIEKETGESLSEEEIIDLANDLLDLISEEQDEEQDDEEDEQDDEEPEVTQKPSTPNVRLGTNAEY